MSISSFQPLVTSGLCWSVGARVQTDDVSSNTRDVIDTNTDMKVRCEREGD